MDKNKIIQTATRYLQRGQFDRAIAEYERILRKDPKDVRTLLKLGEVQQKKGDGEKAASTLYEVAQSYAADGFYLKAVAVYKQVLKLAPKRFEVNQRLADQYQQLGLLSDSMAQLQIVAEAQKESEDYEAALETLRRMSELDPESVPPRLELGEILDRLGRKEEALAELEQAAKALEEARKTDDYLRVAERILKLRGGDPALSRKLAERYMEQGDSKRALLRLQACYEADPKDSEILELLAKVFQELGRKDKAVAAYKEMARALGAAGRIEEESRAWSRVRMLAPEDEEAGQAIGARSQAPRGREGGGLDSTESRMILSSPSRTGSAFGKSLSLEPGEVDAESPLGKLLTEVDVYLKYRLYDKAKEHLQKASAIDPNSVERAERACLVHAALNEEAALRQELMLLVRLHRAADDPVRAAQRMSQLQKIAPGDPEVEALAAEPAAPPATSAQDSQVSFNPFDERSEAALFAATLSGGEEEEEIFDEPLIDEGIFRLEDGSDAGALASVLESTFSELEGEPLAPVAVPNNGEDPSLDAALSMVLEEGEVLSLDLGAAEELLEPDSEPESATSLAELDLGSVVELEVAPVSDAEAPLPLGAPEPVEPEPPVELAAPVAAPAAAPIQEAPAPAPATGEAGAGTQLPQPALEELEELDFFLDQEMFEEASELLAGLHRKHPGHPELAVRQARLPTAALQAGEAPAPAAASPVMETKPEATSPAAGEGAERSKPRVPGFARAVVPEEAEDASFDLGAELRGIFEPEPEGEGAEAAQGLQYSAEEVLAEFKRGISQTVQPGDAETHYNLGLAYREMGLLAEALESFRAVAQAGAGDRWEADGWTMVGLCHAQLGAHEEAIEAFQSGLGSAGLSEEASKALHFEIASSMEALGRQEEALAHYGKVARVDSGYRDVARAILRLTGLDG